MKNATRVMISMMGTYVGLVGIEHAVGEILQGSVAPDGLTFLSWPESAFFRIQGGEPAMTIVPNLLISGILSTFFSLIFLIWVIRFVQRKNGGLVLMLLSIIMLLVGAGFGPPLLGIILSAAATRINAPWTWWRAHLPVGFQCFLGKMWRWSLIACITSWLFLLPGSNFLGYFFGVDNPVLVLVLIITAFGLLLLTIIAGFASDMQGQSWAQQTLTRISD